MKGLHPNATKKLLGEVSEDELAVRLIEAYADVRRPKGKTASEALASMPAGARDPAIRQARTAILYMAECFANAVKPS